MKNNKMWFLFKHQLFKTLSSKAFIISNAIILVVLLLISNADIIFETIKGKDSDDHASIYVLDNSGRSYELFEAALEEIDKMSLTYDKVAKKVDFDKEKIKIKKYDKTEEEAIKEINSGDIEELIVIDNDETTIIKAKIISKDTIPFRTYQEYLQSINKIKTQIAMNESNIDQFELAQIYNPIVLEKQYLNQSAVEQKEKTRMAMGIVFPVIILPFFILVTMVIQMIGSSISEEKQTRTMENIIPYVSPEKHLYAKMLAVNCQVIIQLILFVFIGFAGLFSRLAVIKMFNLGGKFTVPSIAAIPQAISKMGIPSELISSTLLLVILLFLTVFTYSIIAAVFASMTTNAEDFQQIQAPIIWVLIIGYYIGLAAANIKAAAVIKYIAYLPLFSALIAPNLLTVGAYTKINVIINIIIMIVFNYLLLKVGVKIYKEGLLNYSSKDIFKRMFKILRGQKLS